MDSLQVSIEKLRTLILTAVFLEQTRHTSKKSDINVALTIPEKLTPGQTYSLEVSSKNDLSLSARLVKEEPSRMEEEEKDNIDTLQKRFEEAVIKDKEIEIRRKQAMLAGDITEMVKALDAELANNQVLERLGAALCKRDIEPQMPQTEQFRILVEQSKKCSLELFYRYFSPKAQRDSQCKVQ